MPVERDPPFAGLQAGLCILFLPVLMALAAIRDGCRALLQQHKKAHGYTPAVRDGLGECVTRRDDSHS
jgi:hypothetical protein